MKLKIPFIALMILTLCACSITVTNQNNIKHYLYSNNYWYVLLENDNIYTLSFPVASEGEVTNRALHYLLVNKNKTTGALTISVVGGEEYNNSDNVIIKVNYNEYYLPVEGDRAWLTNNSSIKALIEDLQNSNSLTIVNNYNNGIKVTDTYNLKGFNETYNKILTTK